MTKKLARLLRADIQETSDLKSIAAMLAGKGRGGDTLLAHITPKEVGLLKEAGGAGTVNPDTGLLEFYDWTGTGGTVSGYDGGASSYESAPASYSGGDNYDYYQIAPEVSAPAVNLPAAPSGRYDLGYGRSASEGLQMPMPGTSSIGFQPTNPPVAFLPFSATEMYATWILLRALEVRCSACPVHLRIWHSLSMRTRDWPGWRW
jgi:hypothetical protein